MKSQVRFSRVRRRFREALVQSQVRFNGVPEEGSGEGLEGFGAESTGFRRSAWLSSTLQKDL